MSEREIIISNDGSTTVFDPIVNECFHSRHGAIQESLHVFIASGLHYYFSENSPKTINILEVGLGTALNAFLTLKEFYDIETSINYYGIEKYPLTQDIYRFLGYENLVEKLTLEDFLKFHTESAFKVEKENIEFNFYKLNIDIQELNPIDGGIDICYFDAFAPDKQPELWTVESFRRIYEMMNINGILVTYSSKGQVRRNMIEAGFIVEKIPGPKYKREMLRAKKK
jgi:tRNA U34 5-methylaminomethyl-2-thiouridine-forming methyltransferase MnmC